MHQLIEFFVRRPLLVNLALVFLVLSGGLALQTMQFNTYPDVDLGIITVDTYRPGASGEDIELSVTVPLEEEILKVDGIHRLTSNSMEGLSTINVQLDPNNTVRINDKVAQDIQKAVDRATSRLPSDLPQKPTLAKSETAIFPVMEILVSGSVPEETLRQVARKLQNSLRTVDGVAGVSRQGYRKKEIQILLEPHRLHQLGLSYNEIIDAIQRRNVRDSGGSLDSFIAERKVITVGQFEHPKEVEDVIIRSAGPGNYVRVRDVAEVVYGYEKWKTHTILDDGKSGISLFPKKKASADGLSTAAAIRAHVEKIQPTLPPGIELTVFNDSSRFTRIMLDVLVGNAGMGLFLVFIVLWSFFPFRFTIWVTIGIPAAVFMTFAVMPLGGLNITQITMGSIILMLGILVDDAVVTSESIFQEAEKGHSPTDAAVIGAHKVAAPVIVSAATTILAFLPTAFLGGSEGKFMWQLPVVAMLVLMASLVECKLMLPAHIRHALSAKRKSKPRTWFRHLQRPYTASLDLALRNRYITVALFIGICVVIMFWAIRFVSINLYPDVDVDTFYVKVELPAGTSFEHTSHKVQEIGDLVRNTIDPNDLWHVTVSTGHHDDDLKAVSEGLHANWALVTVYLSPVSERETSALVWLAKIREALTTLDGYKSLVVIPLREAPLNGKAVQLSVAGNHDSRYELGAQLMEFVKNHPGTQDAWSSYSPGKDIVNLKINYEALADYNLKVTDVTQAVRVAFDGMKVDELQTVEERIDYRLRFAKRDQGKMATLQSLTLITPSGVTVPLRRLVEFETQPGESTIRHQYGERAITIFAEINREKTSTQGINDDIEKYIEANQLRQKYPQVRIHFGGEIEQQKTAVGNVATAFVLCIAAILFLLVVMFNSVTQPLLILSIIPLGIAGVFLAFAIQGLAMSMASMIGIIGLAGVLVNDSLVMVDTLNKHRPAPKNESDGLFLSHEGILQGATQRLRPIFITTITTVAGLIPAAYGFAGENPFLTPMIMAMLWGVLFGSAITLWFLPCLYGIEQDLRRLWNALQRRFSGDLEAA